MAIVFRYFWLIMLGVIAINGLLYRGRLRRLRADGGITADESTRLGRTLGLGMVLLFGVIGVVQMAADWPSPFCLYAKPLSDPAVLATWLAYGLALAALLAWVFLWGGAELLSRASPALSRFYPGPSWSPRAVRVGVVVIAAAVAAGGVVGRAVAQGTSEMPLCVAPGPWSAPAR